MKVFLCAGGLVCAWARAHAGLHTNGLVRILCVASRKRNWSRWEAGNTSPTGGGDDQIARLNAVLNCHRLGGDTQGRHLQLPVRVSSHPVFCAGCTSLSWAFPQTLCPCPSLLGLRRLGWGFGLRLGLGLGLGYLSLFSSIFLVSADAFGNCLPWHLDIWPSK